MAIKVAITGLGVRGQDWIRAINSSSSFELVASIDVRPSAREQVANNHQIPESLCYSDLETALKSHEDCQAVIIVTPVDQHFRDFQVDTL